MTSIHVQGGRRHRLTVLVVLMGMVLTMFGAGTASAATERAKKQTRVDFVLTILHNNDGESQVVNAGSGLEDFGGAAAFKTVVDDLKSDAVTGTPPVRGAKRGVVMLSSGDNFLAGPEFTAGVNNGVPFYDTIAMELIGYDAVNLGNHDFDFGPEVLADFLAGYEDAPPYVSANLDFSGEPSLQAYVDAGIIAPTTIIRERGEKIGVIGIETPTLPFVSSPRNVVVSDDIANIVNAEVRRLQRQGVNKIILTSHLQSIENEIELTSMLRGVDVIVSGGGDELLANDGDLLVPGDEGLVYGSYPMLASDARGTEVPIVTTSGEYRYVGQLVVSFDRRGNVVSYDGGPVRVATGACNDTLPCDDAVEPDPEVMSRVVEPVAAELAEFDATVLASSQVALDGLRASVRGMETNEGNLIADSLLWQAQEVAADYGVDSPVVALQNGGGIRNNTIIEAGDITLLDTFDMVPFANFLVVVEDVPAAQLKEILENAYSRVEFGDGRFAQIAGMSVVYDPNGTAQIIDGDTGEITTPGTRIISVTLDDTTQVVAGGAVVDDTLTIDVATIDFLANGGDQYPYGDLGYTTVGFTYQQAVANYIVDGLGGLISSADYPEGGEGRITTN